jgi:hypothetical protein
MHLQGMVLGVLEPKMDKNLVAVWVCRARTKSVVHTNYHVCARNSTKSLQQKCHNMGAVTVCI